MKTIDAHQHFWNYDPSTHAWIDDDMAAIRKDFLPENLELVLHENGIDGCIAVQADQTVAETDFLLKMAAQHHFIHGVVGWVDLRADDIEEQLAAYGQYYELKGFRHILQGEPQRDLCLQKAFLKGISLLEQFNFTYDILILKDQLQYIPELVAQFPNQRFVLDHLAKPAIKEKEIHNWQQDIEKVAAHENVYCKLSGMVTEADLQGWSPEDFRPYMDVVVNAFGTKRIMYGSDWPVCLAAGEYEEVINIMRCYFQSFSTREQELFFGGNATTFYNL